MEGRTKLGAVAATVALLGGLAGPADSARRDWQLVPGSFDPGRSPDGNSILLDAPGGLILVDTGRHPEHQARLLAYARGRGRPIVAIFNTHWHLDHSGGNAGLRAAFPGAPLYASDAVEGALKGFLPRSRAQAEAYLASGKASPDQAAEIRGDFGAMDDAASLRPTRPIRRSQPLRVAGRLLQVHLAPFAATEGDVWIHDPRAKLVVAGDLVVAMVPFMDTACVEGWRKALDAIAATPFEILIPGHGAPMTRAEFMTWRTAFSNLLDCGDSKRSREACIAGWKRDAAIFIPPGEARVDGLLGYYLDSRLRAGPEERLRYCKR